jgi:hypothetical protein
MPDVLSDQRKLYAVIRDMRMAEEGLQSGTMKPQQVRDKLEGFRKVIDDLEEGIKKNYANSKDPETMSLKATLGDAKYAYGDVEIAIDDAQKKAEQRGVSELSVKKQLPSAMTKEIGKYLGGRTRKTRRRRATKKKKTRSSK